MKYGICSFLILFLFVGCAMMEPDRPANIVTDPAKAKLVRLQDIDASILFDVRYASTNNFVGDVLYDCAEVYLVKDAAIRLVRVNQRLMERGLRLLVFDGYRPWSVQKRLWEKAPDSRYVANPKYGSRHNRGCAVDLTLANADGRPLEMPTDYDDFTERAHFSFMDSTPEAMANHFILVKAMMAEGFEPINSEWWHFDAPGWRDYPILDVDICEM